jgi:hypothetical protein
LAKLLASHAAPERPSSGQYSEIQDVPVCCSSICETACLGPPRARPENRAPGLEKRRHTSGALLANQHRKQVDFARAPKSRLLPPGWDWKFVARLLNASQLQAKERRASEYASQIQSVRTNVKPGLEVQVLATDLPEELGASLKRYAHGGKPSVCAMVVDVKSPLVQIQVKQASLFVPIEKLLPKGEAMPISNINWTKTGFPHKWCGQY